MISIKGGLLAKLLSYLSNECVINVHAVVPAVDRCPQYYLMLPQPPTASHNPTQPQGSSHGPSDTLLSKDTLIKFTPVQ